ncbi:hypothetical protein D6D01_07856 [Aureobasidium pullulans]|uniref:Uncharacterized protein n=1 Tax=Aureobasidium pullulans TaxID=5580 RepID=A0A4S9KI36_AURPU|nr:hypothetical protein D6D01_07856 [Aureobasidium pullulans]
MHEELSTRTPPIPRFSRLPLNRNSKWPATRSRTFTPVCNPYRRLDTLPNPPPPCNHPLPKTAQLSLTTPSTPANCYRLRLVQPLTFHSYPKHVWSPAGGWYSQPKNWKANTAVMGLAVFTVAGVFFSLSADREHRYKMPEQGRFFPSRYWSRQIREHERTLAPKDE